MHPPVDATSENLPRQQLLHYPSLHHYNPASIHLTGSSAKYIMATNSRNPGRSPSYYHRRNRSPSLGWMHLIRKVAGRRCFRRLTTSCATGSSPRAPRPASTAPSGMRSAKPSTRRSTELGRLSPYAPLVSHRRLLRGRQDVRRFRPARWSDPGGRVRRLQVQGWRGNAGGGRPTCSHREGGRGPRFGASPRRRTRADSSARRSSSPGGVEGQDIQCSRSPSDGSTIASTWPRPEYDWYPVCAGQSEIGRAGCRDLMMASAIDVCNFDASSAGANRMAAHCRAAACFGVRWTITRSRRFRASPRFHRARYLFRKRFILIVTSSTAWR